MSDVKIKYNGNLGTEAIHVKSGETIYTDAPIDNKGKGESFSPTDLFATSLGSCMLTIMGITADTYGFDITGSSIDIKKIMGRNPRRISKLKIIVNIRGTLNKKDRKILIKAAEHCPVSKSINPNINELIKFNFTDGEFYDEITN